MLFSMKVQSKKVGGRIAFGTTSHMHFQVCVYYLLPFPLHQELLINIIDGT